MKCDGRTCEGTCTSLQTLMNAGKVIHAQWECATILKDPLHARVPLGGSKDLLAHVSLEEK